MTASNPEKTEQQEIEKSIIKRFRREIWHPFVQALKIYHMISPGDRIAVCISGGKDSFLLAKCMQEIQAHGEMKFDLKFLAMDPGYRKENLTLIRRNAKRMGIPLTLEKSDIFASVAHAESSPCYLCARMRRGFLYARAKALGCNKIALGHHMDDVIETVLLSVLYAGQFNTMMPKLHSENFPGMELIRPLYFVREESVIAWRDFNHLKFLKCACRFTERTEEQKLTEGQEISSKREKVKELIRSLAEATPGLEKNLLKCADNVNLDACLGYVKNGERHSFLEDYAAGKPASHGSRKKKRGAQEKKKKNVKTEKKKSGKTAEESYVYLLRCADGTFYCGYTNNLKKRLAMHNAGKGAKYTRMHGPCEMVYHETYATKGEALSREHAVKKLNHMQKEKLIMQRR